MVGWRDVPVDEAHVGRTAGAVAPRIRQLFVAAGPAHEADQDAFERKLYVIRRRAELAAGPGPRRADLLLAAGRLQGDAVGAAAAAVLHRPPRPAARERARARPLALLHEHLPELGARPPVPADRPQRRDQHAAGQRELDAGARVAARLGAVRRRPPEGAPRRPPGRIGLGRLRQRARAAHARRALAAPRGDDDDPRGLPGPHRRPRRAARLLPVPPVPDGGLGRAGRDRLHRRARDRRDARPQRPAPRPLVRDEGRLGRARVRDRRARGGAREHHPQGPAAARQALPRRPRARADRRRRRAQGRGLRPEAVRALVRGGGRAARRPARARAARRGRRSRSASASSRSATRRRT